MKSSVASGHQPTISRNPYLLIAAILWLIVFSGFFYSLGLPNNRGIERLDVWLHLDDQAQNLLSELFRFDEAGYGWAYLPQRFPFWGIGLSIILASAGLGYSALKFVRRPSSVDQLEWGYLAIVVGISILSLLVLGLGLCGVMSTMFWRIVVFGLAGVGVTLAWGEKSNTTRVVQQNPDAAVPLETMNLLVALLIAFPFLAAIAPGGVLSRNRFRRQRISLRGPKRVFSIRPYSVPGRTTFTPASPS